MLQVGHGKDIMPRCTIMSFLFAPVCLSPWPFSFLLLYSFLPSPFLFCFYHTFSPQSHSAFLTNLTLLFFLLPFGHYTIMSADILSQQMAYRDETFFVDVYSGAGDNQGVPYVLVEDIQEHFQDATRFRCGKKLVSCIRDADGNFLLPKRFAYRPDEIVEVVALGSNTSLRQLTRQNTIVLQSTSASSIDKDKFYHSSTHFENYVKAMENGQKEQADRLQSSFQQGFSELHAALDKNLDLQRQLNDMQQLMLQMQQQALDRLADLQGRVKALLTATYELHEYPIPRLFIILPKDPSAWDPVSILRNQFRLYFLCECGEQTKVLGGNNITVPLHIHLAKHEGYDIQRPKDPESRLQDMPFQYSLPSVTLEPSIC
ncbi:hypothetical protein K457DRAFT_399169 [Linnemannia elongata AG-77]|uniref:Uncharacterized protein n=1 Tax=Linnemannia elongata AG-77 TaxID=1314771 RepID=A0A197JCE1_9FUNG|nr:hypothetical protein K457DRAFT_399169 [Linnemannia elongata AG-77]